MKSLIKIICVILSVLIIGSVNVYAADSSVTLYGFSFDINEDGNAVIHSFDDRTDKVEIPAALMKADVTEIDDYAFFEDTYITLVSFEKATKLKKLGDNAFYGCTKLKELILPDNLEEAGFGVFQNCTDLKSVSLGGLAKVPSQAFYNCSSLERLDIPETVEAIGSRSFENCTSLEDVYIPDSVTSIEDNAFSGIDNLIIYCNEGSYAESYAIANNIKYDTPKSYDLGDANLDGRLNILDATLIQKFKIGAEEIPLYRGENFADVNRDGSVTIRDATLIQMKLARLIDEF